MKQKNIILSCLMALAAGPVANAETTALWEGSVAGSWAYASQTAISASAFDIVQPGDTLAFDVTLTNASNGWGCDIKLASTDQSVKYYENDNGKYGNDINPGTKETIGKVGLIGKEHTL